MAHGPFLEEYKVIMDMKIYVSCSFTCPSNLLGHPAAFVTSHMNGLKPFERTIERTTETITPSSKSITAAAMTTNRKRASTLPSLFTNDSLAIHSSNVTGILYIILE